MSVLFTKTLKIMEITLYEKTKQHCEKRVILVFFSLRTKKINRMQKSLLLRYNWITFLKTCILSVELITYKNAKMHGKYTICGKERTLRWTCNISVFFWFLRFQNRENAWISYYMEKKNITKNVYFEFISHCEVPKKKKNARKSPYMGKRNEVCLLSVYERVRHQIALKSMESTLYGKTKQYYQKRFLECI